MIVETFDSYPRNERRIELVVTPARPTQTVWASFTHQQALDLAAQLLAQVGEVTLSRMVSEVEL